MSRIYWITTVALGLILFAPLGQAQEKAQGEQGQAQAEHKPAQTLPIPVPADIIEDEAATEARKRREAEARQHEIDDLIAQQGMNAATQAMNKATQRMADYAWYSTIFVGVGTALLVLTLWLTRQANKAAQAAVDVTRDTAQRELRAYVGVEAVDENQIEWRGMTHTEIKISLRNFGQTPATDLRVQLHVDIIPLDTIDGPPLPYGWIDNSGVPEGILNPGNSLHVSLDTEAEATARTGNLSNAFFAFGEIRYNDIFDNECSTKFCFWRSINSPHDRHMRPYKDGNDAT